jgi:tetratricopeptide (TPR) repeat protein
MLPILILFAGYFIYMMSRRKKLENQVELFNKLLYVEKSPQKYIAEVDKLLLKFQTENERNINYIQKTTGLLYAGRFDEAVSILNEKVKKIPPNWQAVYYHNMLLSLYFRGDTEKANEILKEVKSTIDSYYKKDYNKVTIELIYAVSDYYNNRISECKEFFKLLPEITKNKYYKLKERQKRARSA